MSGKTVFTPQHTSLSRLLAGYIADDQRDIGWGF